MTIKAAIQEFIYKIIWNLDFVVVHLFIINNSYQEGDWQWQSYYVGEKNI